MANKDVADVIAKLKSNGTDVVRVSYSDLIGVDRGRDILVEELESAMSHGIAFCRAAFHTTPMGDVVEIEGGLSEGLPDISAVPDLDTLIELPWEPGVVGSMADIYNHDGTRADDAPRAALRNVSDKLAEIGLGAVVGPELEFYLLERAEGVTEEFAHDAWKRYADAPGNVYVVGAKGDPRGVLLHMLRQLRDAKLHVTAANHEFCSGQFEINLYHSDMLDAADRAFRMKSGVQEIARHKGLRATFMAKPFNDEGGSGFHLHISLVDENGKNVFGDSSSPDGISDIGHQAIAGVLKHAKALAALLNPTINSYKRFGPDTLAPWLIDWGLDNRSAMIRIPPERGEATRMEVRLGDASASPYLAIAGTVAAAYLGIRDKLTPPDALEGYGYNPEKAEMLPQGLGEALDALEADSELSEILGKYCVDSFLAFKRNELERFGQFITDWEVREYTYHL